MISSTAAFWMWTQTGYVEFTLTVMAHYGINPKAFKNVFIYDIPFRWYYKISINRKHRKNVEAKGK